MRLEKLEIRGFKSFAQKAEIVFDEGMTAIVGPNGSGKSNIADAIRWVLGEQSAKTLRGGKMEDIIFSGAEGLRAQAYCEVILTFNNTEGVLSLPLDFHEVSIMRRVYRSGESEYFINRNACRLRDIVDLFRDTGVGKEGYSIIGQGRVDEILSGRSEDRRAVFEEAAGVTKYKARKEEAERKLAKTQENITRIEDILQELEGQLEPLQAQSEVAKTYLKMREEVREIELNVFLQQYDRLQERQKNQNDTIRQLHDEYQACEIDSKKLAEKSQKRNEHLRENEKKAAQHNALLLALTGEAEKTEGQVKLACERVQNLDDAKAQALERLENCKTRLRALDELLQSAKSTGADKERMLADLTNRIDQLESSITQQTQSLQSAEAQLETQKNQIIEAMNRLSNAKVQASRLETMRASLLERQNEAQRALDKSRDELASLQAETVQEQQGLDALQADREELTQKSLELRKQWNEMQRQAEQNRQELRAIERERDNKHARLRVLREMKREYEGFYASVRNFLRDCEKIPQLKTGIVGVVAELIRVPAKLETALETALGAALQHIVTQDEKSAQRAIEHLRAKRYGRATFLPLTAVKGRVLNPQEKALLNRKGCLGCASELLAYQTEHQNVIENLLGRTVICETLEDGIALARASKQSFRIATLAGDIINPGGSMTGGSVQKSEFSLLGRGREADELAASLQELDIKLREGQMQSASMQKALEEKEMECKAVENQLHIAEIALTRQNEKLDMLDTLSRQQSAQREQHQSEQEQITSTLADIEEQWRQADDMQSEIVSGQTVSQLDVAAAQEALARQRQMREDAIEERNALRVRLASLEKEKSAQQDDIQRMQQEHERLHLMGMDDQSAIQSAQEKKESLEIELSALEEILVEKRREMEQIRHENDAVQNERSVWQAELDQITQRHEALQEEMRQNSERRHKAELSAGKTELELETLQERIWQEYELTYEGASRYRKDIVLSQAQRELEERKTVLRELGTVNVHAIDDYISVRERFESLGAQHDDLLKAKSDLEKLIQELLRTMCQRFKEQFTLIDANFGQTFRELFGGGKASLRLANEIDIMGSEIEIIAQPPGKRLQLLSLLSGGERALTAIALLFSMLKLKPTPFCILDEIEASLDEANVDHFARYVKRYAKDTQFILITHRKGSMAVCDTLYGVTMEGKGVSRLVSVRLNEAEELAKNSA